MTYPSFVYNTYDVDWLTTLLGYAWKVPSQLYFQEQIVGIDILS